MNQEEIKDFIADMTLQGLSLQAIQDELAAKGVKMRFIELRLLAAEIDTVIQKKKAEKQLAEEEAARKKAKQAPPRQTSEMPGQNAPDEFGKSEEPDELDADMDDTEPDAGNLNDAPAEQSVGKTTVTVDKIQRPGFMVTGTVVFGSGVQAGWYIDQMGRLGLENATGRPTEQDAREFQMELQKILG